MNLKIKKAPIVLAAVLVATTLCLMLSACVPTALTGSDSKTNTTTSVIHANDSGQSEIANERESASITLTTTQASGRSSPIVEMQTNAPAPITFNQSIRELPIDQPQFALNLAVKLFSEADDSSNFICSPLSVWLPLAALANATAPAYKQALLETLGAKNVQVDQLNEYAKQIIYLASNGQLYGPDADDESETLRIVNALFVDQAETIKDSFAQTFAEYYSGTAFSVDFDSDEAVDVVNAWAGEQTDGLVDGIVEGFDKNAVAAIVNAICYSSFWIEEFDESETQSGLFHSEGDDVTVDYMHGEIENQRYFEDERVQVIQLLLQSGAELWVVLPKNDTANAVYTTMTSQYYQEIEAASQKCDGAVTMPKFEIVSDINLEESLVAIGVPLFDADTGPLQDGLVESPLEVYLESATQSATIKVDERGTTAGAVTVALSAATADATSEPFEMICDKPFVFILEHDGVVFFTGVVNDPSLTA